MAHKRSKNPSTLITVLVSTVSALVGGAVVHQLWRSGKIGVGVEPIQTVFYSPIQNPLRRRRR